MSVFTWIVNTVAGWTSWMNPLIEGILCMLKQWWCWAVSMLIDLVLIPFFSPIIAAIPVGVMPDLSFLADYWYTVDQWVPLSEMLTGYAAYATFLVIFVTLRFVYRFVPFMG